ncbi:SDR family oxidoreductase [Saccharopolyspora sp. TS4A08]|uniref:SDR family oxidoreductase n=1 Tax=Saccharopolyspora ipomoeae TaxID=3042027 RepID=A0ABT6PIV3_9PSEU|nr:SDR family oxidoreductase [Saccharopolyspora sp. TS4A08]MDI2027931.1 SDR family oxidoreductase [Saccharopolyspora sp. TS4A08]
MIDPRLRDRVAVITGCDTALGISAAIARALARQQVRPLLITEPGADDHLTPALRADGHTAEALAVDLTDPHAPQQVYDTAEARLGPVEILVLNTAPSRLDTFTRARGAEELTATGIDAHHERGTRAPALLIAEHHRRHRARRGEWGRIITLSTDVSDGAPGQVSRAAAAHALESLSRSAAQEFGPTGITVNIIACGAVRTGWLHRDDAARLAETSPLGRLGHPDDIADIAAFLASHQARWLTGQTLYAGGGRRMR